jgi:uncharacterized protein YfaS (alpha-2-macroglobulin family)
MDASNSSYRPGDQIKINGHVSSSPIKLVAVQVKDPDGNTMIVRTVKTDVSGNFVLEFKLPTTAKAGNYNIIANANIDGNIVTQTKEIAETATVPEFSSIAPLVLVASITSILVLSMKIRPNLKI